MAQQYNISMFKQRERGVALYLAIIIMSVLLSLALAISSIAFNQLRMVRDVGSSVIAFYAAETGVERTLYGISRGDQKCSHYEDSLANGSSYVADIIAPDGSCPSPPAPAGTCSAPNYCLKSFGVFKQDKRALLLVR